MRTTKTWKTHTLGCVIVAPSKYLFFLHKIRGATITHPLWQYCQGSCQNQISFAFFFLNMFVLLCHTFTNFYWRKDLCQADLSDTLNMFVKYAENFLEPFGKKVSAQNMGFVRIFRPDFELHFFKISTYFTFPDI